ncbi:hypothetical protein BATDEDRAFT_22896 [Batrachochytrium dendrobatidis JAM81]|uniref:CUB domain-containing protein n=1 Tax=Batrachochytrium dendrobatidis (strain JAM81 / FGSC 10211) TaxID=684364 RepID=F4NW45_BATDJ|nr:uncharacterized protein BATDEDRAFT_22896 [Batrachochytrium dendrobatidis JAM81]EGF82414.1 hypothetical protein BATDEDRAFT_22896 [Batrachochytrium dendrobatidis JAM81]|eukprot:XP_006676659.1 hypothetical protein BATDEDRAFT_22896 [Batrachochytrium dendrobatidis JAM81]
MRLESPSIFGNKLPLHFVGSIILIIAIACNVPCIWALSDINSLTCCNLVALRRNVGKVIVLVNINLTIFKFRWDFVSIYDGPATSSPPLAVLCGNRSLAYGYNDTFVSTGSSMTVMFTSDSLVNTNGFIGVFQSQNATETCDVLSDCGSNGQCNNGLCLCNSGYYGAYCQHAFSDMTVFSPRQQHAVAYDKTLDVMYLTFGRNWTDYYSDMWAYSFGTSNYRAMTDLWSFDPVIKSWKSIQSSISSSPTPTMDSSTVVVVKSQSYQLYVYGGFDALGYFTRVLSMFDSATLKWTNLASGPIALAGGTGVYNEKTNTIQFFSAYPLLLTDSILQRHQYVFEYSISTDTWSQNAVQGISHNRYLAQAVYIDQEYAIMFGGQEKGWDSSRIDDDCFSGEMQILDIACGTWSYYDDPTVTRYRRLGFGMVMRNNSLVLVGGSDGVLKNDIVQINLSTLPQPSTVPPDGQCNLVSGNLTLPPQCKPTVNRDICRAQTYCSAEFACSTCSERLYCGWCNDRCGFDNSTLPLPNLQISQNMSFVNLCLAATSIKSPNSCPADVDVILSNLSSPFVMLRSTIIAVRPSTPTSTAGKLTFNSTMLKGYLGPITIRISYNNDVGVYPLPPSPARMMNQFNSTTYMLSILYTSPGVTNSNPATVAFPLSDIATLVLIFLAGIFMSVGASYLLRYSREHFLRRQFAGTRAGHGALGAPAALPKDPPRMYRLMVDLGSGAGIKWYGAAMSQASICSIDISDNYVNPSKNDRKSVIDVFPHPISGAYNGTNTTLQKTIPRVLVTRPPTRWPISVENLTNRHPNTMHPLASTTCFILYPGAEKYIRQGDLPVMALGTHIFKVYPVEYPVKSKLDEMSIEDGSVEKNRHQTLAQRSGLIIKTIFTSTNH